MIAERFSQNPILTPNPRHSWEAEAVFNGCPVRTSNKVFLLYRALSLPHYHSLAKATMRISDIGIAESRDGIHFGRRRRFIIPEYSWEKFGCEDPRVTKLDGKYFVFYTALSLYPFQKDGIKVGMAISPDLQTVQEKHLVTPFNAKAMALFPERIRGKRVAVLTVHTDQPPSRICLAFFEHDREIWDQARWKVWYRHFERCALPLQRRETDHLEVGAPPLKTKHGWLLIYSCIQNYRAAQRIFGIEAALLDLKNPFKVLAMTKSPLLTPEEYYERIGLVPNVVFPSGAIQKGKSIHLYYGAADTTCCLASVRALELLETLRKPKRKSPRFIRSERNPILSPVAAHPWEAKAVFNPAAIFLRGRVHLVYRAMSEENTSVLGYAVSKNGVDMEFRSPRPIYLPREPFEQKGVPGGNSGCEDPRLTRIRDRIYMCYTAYDGKNVPRVALTRISVRDFLNQEWEWGRPVLISPPGFDDKDACLFPKKIMGRYLVIHRVGNDIDLAAAPTLEFDGTTWLEEYRWMAPRQGAWDSKKVGVAAPPIETEKGWVLFYHGVSERGTYRVGAALLDREDPFKILARTEDPLFEPETAWEKAGQVPNVVFPCGAVLLGDTLFMYYGGADRVVGVATMKIGRLLELLKPSSRRR